MLQHDSIRRRIAIPPTIGLLFLIQTAAMAQNNPAWKIFDDQVSLVENDILSLAEAMPAGEYDFIPADGDFDGVRNFGEQVRHLSTMIFITAARVLEELPPQAPGTHNNGPDTIRSKDEVVAYLKDAIAYARSAMATLTEDNVMDPVEAAFGRQPRGQLASGVIYHSYNHYGQMVVYARMRGIVPPGSVPTGEEDAVVR